VRQGPWDTFFDADEMRSCDLFHLLSERGARPRQFLLYIGDRGTCVVTPIGPSAGLVRWPPEGHFDDVGIEQLHKSLPGNTTDEVRTLRDRGIADHIWSSITGKDSGSS
jgi:hypothetical protein